MLKNSDKNVTTQYVVEIYRRWVCLMKPMIFITPLGKAPEPGGWSRGLFLCVPKI